MASQTVSSNAAEDDDDELLKLCMMAEQDVAAVPASSRAAPVPRAQVAPPPRQPSRPTAMVMEESFPSQTKATDKNTLRELQQLFADAQQAPAACLSTASRGGAFRPTLNFADAPVNVGAAATGKDSLKKMYGVVLNPSTENAVPQPAPGAAAVLYRDKWSGFRLTSVLTSPVLLDKYMEHRRPLRVASLEREIKGDAVPYDFVLFGIVVHGGLTKLTAKNEKYITWRVSDLKSGSVTVCIFKRAYEKHKIIGEGTVVAILNPSIWKGDKKCPSVSCSNDTQILPVGICSDLGVCKGLTRTGEPCGVNINLEQGSVCEFHLQQQLHAVRSKSAVLNNRSVAGASSNRLFVPGSDSVVVNQPLGFRKAGPKVAMEVAYTTKMNAPTPGRIAISCTSSVSLENYEYFASFAPPPPATTTWKPTIASSPTVRKIQETISAKAAESAAKSAQKVVESGSKTVAKSSESAAKTTQRPASRPAPALLASPVAQPDFFSADLDDDSCLVVLDGPEDAPSAGTKRASMPHEKPSNACKKPAAVSSAGASAAPAVVPKQTLSSQQPKAAASSSNTPTSAIKSFQSRPAVGTDPKSVAPQIGPAVSKMQPSQPSSSFAAMNPHVTPSAVAALQAKIKAASSSEIYANRQSAVTLPGGQPIPAPRQDNSQLLNKARNFGVDLESVKSQRSAHEDIAEQSIKDREQRHTDLLFQAAKLEEKQMGTFETKVSVWHCTVCSYVGYKYCPMHEDKAQNKRKEMTQRYFACANCKHRITWLKGPICSATCSKCGCSQWKQSSQFKGKVSSSEDVWQKANTPSEFSLYHQR